MADVAKIINRALRLIKIVDAGEAATGEDAATAIEALNDMVGRWEANGLSMGWTPVSLPGDVLPAPDESHEALAYNLALRLSSEYGSEVDQLMAQRASESLAELRRDRMTTNPIKQVASVPMAVWRGYWGNRGW